MTSNAGAENIISPKRLGFGTASDAKADYNFMKDRVMEEVRRLFKPEFLNRIDEIIVFHQLNKEDMKGIVEIMLSSIEKRTREQLNLHLSVSEEAKALLIEKGYDEKYGARPLRRTIQTMLEDQLAQELLDGRIKAGCRVEAGAGAQGLTFTVRAARTRKKAETSTGKETAKTAKRAKSSAGQAG